MKISMDLHEVVKRAAIVASSATLVLAAASAQDASETEERIKIAAANMEDAVVVDCQLPGKLRRLGGTRTYLTPGRLIRTSAIACRTRGGEYTIGDLASGTLSLKRWLPPAREGDPEAQYYVARIYVTGMDDVPIDYVEAARWYQAAAEQGYAEAKQELGYLYEQGLGVERDELKALNLQREASGLGDALDYAYKIENAEAIAADLKQQLTASSITLRETQQKLRASDTKLAAARSSMRANERQIASLAADLNAARAAAQSQSASRVSALEAELEEAVQKLSASQQTIVDLEQERLAARETLDVQLAGGQAAQLELRELRARTEGTEQRIANLSAELAEAQQRLIQSDEELRRLRESYMAQSEQLASERERFLAARARTDTDVDALVAARQAELAASEARVKSLENALAGLRNRLQASESGSDQQVLLRRQLDELENRYDTDVAKLRSEKAALQQVANASQQDLEAQVQNMQKLLAERGNSLESRRREIDSLSAEADRLRSMVEQLQASNVAMAETSDTTIVTLRDKLLAAQQSVADLRNQVDSVRTEKAALESKLANNRVELQQQIASNSEASGMQIKLLEAEIAAATSTINSQALRISMLEKQVDERDVMTAELREQVDIPVTMPKEVRDAMAVLDLARSGDGGLGQYHALLIANEEYVHMPSLSTPVRDAYEIEKLLITKYGFEVEVLANVTDDDVMRKLHDYANTLTEDDNLLVYYAGRGNTPDGPPDRAYWLGVDADPALRNTWLLAEHVSEKIKEIRAKRILLVTDSCFSRRRVQAVTTAIGRGLDPDRFRLLSKFRSRYVLTSGANVPVFDEDGDTSHSLFAKTFLEILRQNTNVLSGEMLSFEMINRVRERVEDPERVIPTYNSLQDAGHVAGDFFFVPAQEPRMAATEAGARDAA